jgi:hypothetical protein
LLGIEVGDTDVSDLVVTHQLGEFLGRVLERRVRVRPVDLKDVNVFAVQSTKALVDALANPGGAGVPDNT